MPAYCKSDTPNACWNDIPAEDKDAAMMYAKLMGDVALDILGGSGDLVGAVVTYKETRRSRDSSRVLVVEC